MLTTLAGLAAVSALVAIALDLWSWRDGHPSWLRAGALTAVWPWMLAVGLIAAIGAMLAQWVFGGTKP